MKKPVQDVSDFYNTIGWTEDSDQITLDAVRWEDLRHYSRHYISKCRLRVNRHIPAFGDKILDMASGPIQYKEYLEYSKNYNKRYCVDFSSKALESAKRKIGENGKFFCGNFLDIDFEENYFDCTISLHTIYHIDETQQEEAIRKLVYVTKQSKPIIIVYSNPDTLFHKILVPLSFCKRKIKTLAKKITKVFRQNPHTLKPSTSNGQTQSTAPLYFHPNPISWWSRFSDIADIKIVPWRSLTADMQKAFIPNNLIGQFMLNCLWRLEELFPNFFVKHFYYPMIILTKK